MEGDGDREGENAGWVSLRGVVVVRAGIEVGVVGGNVIDFHIWEGSKLKVIFWLLLLW